MTGKRKPWRQISIQAVLVLTLIFATFAAGYRSGYQQSVEYQFQDIERLIDVTVTPKEWEELGGPAAVTPYPHNSLPGCILEAVVEGDALSQPAADVEQPDGLTTGRSDAKEISGAEQ